jgi:hypothetical protein
MFMGVNMAEGMLAVLLPLWARDILGVDAAGYGLLASAFTTGLFVGALAVGGVRWWWPLGRSIAAGVLGTGLALAPLALGPAFSVVARTIFLAGLAESPVTLWANTIRMRLIPAELRGRAFGVLGTLVKSTPSLGGLAAGGLLAAAGRGPDGGRDGGVRRGAGRRRALPRLAHRGEHRGAADAGRGGRGHRAPALQADRVSDGPLLRARTISRSGRWPAGAGTRRGTTTPAWRSRDRGRPTRRGRPTLRVAFAGTFPVRFGVECPSISTSP